MNKLYFIILLLIFTFEVYSQIDFKKDFLLDSTKTTYVEYIYSIGSHKRNRFVSYHAVKNNEKKTLDEKYYHSYDEQFDWTVSKFNKNWQVVEEIDLDKDSIMIGKEVFHYDLNSGKIRSVTYDQDGKTDTSDEMYFYFKDGQQRGFKFTYQNLSNNSVSIYEGEFYVDSLNNYIQKKYFEQVNDSSRNIYKIENYYYESNQVVSLKTTNGNNEIISQELFKYKNDQLIESYFTSSNKNTEEREEYFYVGNKLVSILGYSKKDNVIEPYTFLKIIEIE